MPVIHETTVIGEGPFRALCTCGWFGPRGREVHAAAFDDGKKHKLEAAAQPPTPLDPIEGQRLALLREAARNRTGNDAAWTDVQFLLHLFDKARAATMEER